MPDQANSGFVLEDTSVPIEDLLDLLQSLRKEAATLRRSIGEVEMEIRRRAQEAGQTLIVSDTARASLKVSRTYDWDVARFKREASKFFSAADLNRIITEVPPQPAKEKIETAKLLPLAKRLGASVEKAVMACCTVIESDPKIEIEEIDEGDRPL